MTEPTIAELEAERDRLYAQLSRVGDFRRGSVSENWRKCGKPNCACAQPGHPGHGPRFLWTRSAGARRTVGRQLATAEVDKVRAEVAAHGEFAATVEQIEEVSEKICEARPAPGTGAAPAAGAGKGGSGRRSRRRDPRTADRWNDGEALAAALADLSTALAGRLSAIAAAAAAAADMAACLDAARYAREICTLVARR